MSTTDGADAAPRTPRVEKAYRTLREHILNNEWQPGYQALEQDLALALGMSRTPVREALIRLQQEGLVDVVPRHGMRVLPVSATDMREIYQVLTSLEPMAAELAARRSLSRRELAPLEKATSAMEKAVRREDRQAWAEADEQFHRHLVLLAGNAMLAQTVFRFWDRAHRARMVTLALRPLPVAATNEHRALTAAIAQGQDKLAARIHRKHRERGAREQTRILASIDSSPPT